MGVVMGVVAIGVGDGGAVRTTMPITSLASMVSLANSKGVWLWGGVIGIIS